MVCAKEHEDKASLATALERYRVNQPHLHPIAEIKDYLQMHFSRDTNQTIHALDPEGYVATFIRDRQQKQFT